MIDHDKIVNNDCLRSKSKFETCENTSFSFDNTRFSLQTASSLNFNKTRTSIEPSKHNLSLTLNNKV